MADLPETSSFPASVYGIQTTDPVEGGDETKIANKQAKALADRTRYLKDHVDDLEADVAAIQAALAAGLTTPGAGDDDNSAATTAFVHRAQGGVAFVDAAGAGNVTIGPDDWGCAVIVLTGARTADGNVLFPTRADYWHVINRTTGAFKLTCKYATGTGVVVARTRGKGIIGDGTNIVDAETDLASRTRTITATTTFANGDDVFIDQSGGTFSTNAITSPADGDSFVVRGNFAATNHTISRNGQLVLDKDDVAQAMNVVLDRNNVSERWTYIGSRSAWFVSKA